MAFQTQLLERGVSVGCEGGRGKGWKGEGNGGLPDPEEAAVGVPVSVFGVELEVVDCEVTSFEGRAFLGRVVRREVEGDSQGVGCEQQDEAEGEGVCHDGC